MKKKVDAWVADAEKLASIVKTHPHTAYCHRLSHRWKFTLWTSPIDEVLLALLEAVSSNHLLTSISGKRDISDTIDPPTLL